MNEDIKRYTKMRVPYTVKVLFEQYAHAVSKYMDLDNSNYDTEFMDAAREVDEAENKIRTLFNNCKYVD